MTLDLDRLVAAENPDAVILASPERRVLTWNNGAAAMFGYAADEALGRPLDALIIPDELQAEFRRAFTRALDTGFSSYETTRRRKDRALVDVDVTFKLLRPDGADGETLVLCTYKDVSELQVLRDSKLFAARYRDLIESMPDAIIMANRTGRMVLANTHAESQFGYDRGELVGKPVELLLPQRQRDVHVRHRANFFTQPRTRAMGAGLTLNGLRKDGSEFPVEISLSPLSTEEGTLVISAIRDITERREIERVLSEKNAELENAAEAKNRFLANMSHELRTPLNAIIGFTGTLLMRLPGPLTADQEKQLSTIQGSARHLLALINDLLDVAKIESGKVELIPEQTSCIALIEELATTLRQLAERKGLAFDVTLPERDIEIFADRRTLRQILINLVNNAIKYTDAGGVGVALRRGGNGHAGIEFRVTDTGIGIRAEDQARLFQAFTQLDSSSTRRYEGTGLGLHLSQKLATLLGGRITLESQEGKGSTFVLTLPGAEPWPES